MMIGPEEPPSWSGKRKRDDQHHHHQRGKKERPDFARLAGKYDYFARHAMRTKKKSKSHEMDKVFIDFTSWQATHDLCRALLEEIGSTQNINITEISQLTSSIDKNEISKTMTSSGTSSQQVSKIYIDKGFEAYIRW